MTARKRTRQRQPLGSLDKDTMDNVIMDNIKANARKAKRTAKKSITLKSSGDITMGDGPFEEQQFPTRIGLLVTHPNQEMKKEELCSISYKRPWLYKADPYYVCKRNSKTTNPAGPGSKGVPHDASAAYYIKNKYAKYGVEVDMISPGEITPERLARNDINFFLIYDLLEAFHTDKTNGKKRYQAVAQIMKKANNIFPPLSYQKLVNSKIKYYRFLQNKKIPICPTITMTTPEYKKLGHDKAMHKILGKINRAGWGKFVAKPVYGMESRDLKFFNVNGSARELERIAKFCKYAFAKYPGLVFQRCIKGFGNTREAPEVRMYFVGDDYKYSVTHLDRGCYTPSQEGNVGRSWPTSWGELPMTELRALGRKVLEELPQLKVRGRVLPRLLTRLDMGCYIDGKVVPYVNEVEYVPSLYVEEHKHIIDGMLGEQMVKIARILLTGEFDMEHLV